MSSGNQDQLGRKGAPQFVQDSSPPQPFSHQTATYGATRSPTNRYKSKPSGSYRSSHSGGRGQAEQLDEEFKIQEPKFFKTYKVFEILWHEGAGHGGDSASSHASTTLDQRFREGIFSKVRKMVVVAVLSRHCICVPIRTYRRQATSKSGVVPEHHAIVYTTKEVPPPLEAETQADRMHSPIQVVPKIPTSMLDPESRINFSELHTVHRNCKVKPYGHVAEICHGELDYIRSLVLQSILPSLQPKYALLMSTAQPGHANSSTRAKASGSTKGKGRVKDRAEKSTTLHHAGGGAEMMEVEDLDKDSRITST